jgi:dihydrofolate synthase / folylpolyglutamate synthase
MDYRQAQTYLKTIRQESCKLEISNIRRMIECFPADLSRIHFIQVAGTNGKGSTSHFLASILRSAGYRVGLFTSPHLQDVRERITVNGRKISRNDFARGIERVRRIGLRMRRRSTIRSMPTFFEHLFLAALDHFHRQQAEWVVLEVGLGGRLDATSTITPDISVITNISKDHTDVLGGTIVEIAREKAGIIKPKVPLICGCPPGSPSSRVIRASALRNHAEFHEVFRSPARLEVGGIQDGYECRYRTRGGEYRFRVRLNGRHQTRNAAIAVQTIDVLRREGWPVSDRAIARGIESMFIPARIETFIARPGEEAAPRLILDGGHNREGIRVLTEYLDEQGLTGLTLIFGVLKDKAYRKMVGLLEPYVQTVIATQPHSDRALPAERLVSLFRGKKVIVETDMPKALEIAKKLKRDIMIAGSLYLAGEMRTLIRRRNGTWISRNSRTSKSVFSS